MQLPAAERQGVEVVTSCRGRSAIEERARRRRGRRSRRVGEPSASGRRASTASAREGRSSSPAAPSARPPCCCGRGLRRALPALGRYFTCHPALILVGEHERPITNDVGHPKSYYCDQFAESEGFLLETCMYFPFTTAKNLTGFGGGPRAVMRRWTGCR